MFREMRENRRKQQLTQEETIAIFERNTSGVLSVLGDEDYPYGVPLAYLYSDGKIYVHGGKHGHKMDGMRKHEKVSFCVIDMDEVHPEAVATYYRSAIAFGKVRFITDEEQVRKIMWTFAKKYAPVGMDDAINHEIETEIRATELVEIQIEHMTGKEAIELLRARKQ